MYNGIGLQTARGSGTNGYVQTNKFFVRPRTGGKPVNGGKGFEDDQGTAGLSKKPNKDILEHDRKRQIELKLVILEDKLTDQGYSDAEIAQKLEEARVNLEAAAATSEESDAPKISDTQTHQVAARKEKQMEAFRAALGLPDPQQQAEEGIIDDEPTGEAYEGRLKERREHSFLDRDSRRKVDEDADEKDGKGKESKKQRADIDLDVVAALSIPVIANGDVLEYDDFSRIKAATGAASVMVARGAMWNALFKTKEMEARSELKQILSEIFKEFMTGITKLEELGNTANNFLLRFQQGLSILQRPPIVTSSKLIENIIKKNETRRLQSYLEAGCINIHDAAQSTRALQSLLLELERLTDEAALAIETATELDKESSDDLVTCDEENTTLPFPQVTEYATLIAVVYSMVKQNYAMQEKIVKSLSLKSSSGELETYTLMWSLCPFVEDEIMKRAWKCVY